ncbi:MAG: hypothetical protein AAFZ15_28475 [Bacteroidota bacterium]
MDKEVLYEKIEAYLDGTLPASEQQKLTADPTVQPELRLHRELASAIGETDVLRLENLLMTEGKKHLANLEVPHKKAKLMLFFKKYRALAAGLAILLMAAFLLPIFTQQGNDLFSEHFKDYPMYLNTRSANAADNFLDKAIQCYVARQFECANENFAAFAKSNPDHFGAVFYTGLTALQLEKTTEAIEYLQIVANDGDNFYVEPARWYLALAYLKSNEKLKAELVLNEIVTSNNDFKEKAEALLNDLD